METQSLQVRSDILARLHDRSLMPGDRIDEKEMSSRLKLSMTPIREALIALEAEGVVQRRRRSGACIVVLDLEGLIKNIEFLAELEGSCAYRAAKRINPEQARTLEDLTRRCAKYAQDEPRNHQGYFDLNLSFHRSIYAASGNEVLVDAINQAGLKLVAYLGARHSLPGNNQISAQEHYEISHAILNSDPDTARSLMISHVSFSDSTALDVVNYLKSAKVAK